jgi:hypothetical protein
MYAFLQQSAQCQMWLRIAEVALAARRLALRLCQLLLVSPGASSTNFDHRIRLCTKQMLTGNNAYSLSIQFLITLFDLAQATLALPTTTSCELYVYSPSFNLRLVQFECLLERITVAELEEGTTFRFSS